MYKKHLKATPNSNGLEVFWKNLNAWLGIEERYSYLNGGKRFQIHRVSLVLELWNLKLVWKEKV